MALLEKHSIDLALIDLDIENPLDGLSLVALANSRGAYTVILTSHEEDEVVAKGYESGAKDFITKPLSDEALSKILSRCSPHMNSGQDIENIKKKFITKDPETKSVLERLGQLRFSDKAVLLQGPSGTGKTHLARIIHELTNSDSKAPFISLNCAQFNETTLDSELFGHVKGSFTGALENKTGLIKEADGGTLFLDEIHGLSPKAQLKLLTALDQGIIYPMGANKPEKVTFKVICATSESLEELVERGYFRRDLYFRIKTFEYRLKGLKDRVCDVIPLINLKVESYERKIFIAPEAKKLIESYDWPGNVREVNDLVENWNTFGVGIVNKEDLPAKMNPKIKRVKEVNSFNDDSLSQVFDLGLKTYLEEHKSEIITKVLKITKGKQVEAAKLLNISKSQMSKEVTRMKNGK